MTKLSVSMMTHDTIDQVVSLGEQMQAESIFASLPFNKERAEFYAKQSANLSDKNPVFLLHDGDEVVGFLSACLTPVMFSYSLGAAEEYLYVKPDYRGGRGAYLLLKEFVSWAKTFDVQFIRASITTGVKSGAGRLYEHFGMKEVGTNHVWIKNSDS